MYNRPKKRGFDGANPGQPNFNIDPARYFKNYSAKLMSKTLKKKMHRI